MKNLKKVLLLSGVSAGLLLGANSAFAGTEKVWTDNAPHIRLHASSNPSDYSVQISYDKSMKRDNTTVNVSVNAETTLRGAKHILGRAHVRKGGSVTFKTFLVNDKDGNLLPNCNLMENPLFTESSTHFNILVDEEGCHFS